MNSSLKYFTFKDKAGTVVQRAKTEKAARKILAEVFMESADLTKAQAKRVANKIPLSKVTDKDPFESTKPSIMNSYLIVYYNGDPVEIHVMRQYGIGVVDACSPIEKSGATILSCILSTKP